MVSNSATHAFDTSDEATKTLKAQTFHNCSVLDLGAKGFKMLIHSTVTGSLLEGKTIFDWSVYSSFIQIGAEMKEVTLTPNSKFTEISLNETLKFLENVFKN